MGRVERRSRPDRATANVVTVGLILAERDGRSASSSARCRNRPISADLRLEVPSAPTARRRSARAS